MRWNFGVLPQLGEAIPLVTVQTDYDFRKCTGRDTHGDV